MGPLRRMPLVPSPVPLGRRTVEFSVRVQVSCVAGQSPNIETAGTARRSVIGDARAIPVKRIIEVCVFGLVKLIVGQFILFIHALWVIAMS